MDAKTEKKTSKFISLVLRHKPEEIGICLDEHGWTDVRLLLKAMSQCGRKITMEDLECVVANNNKKRFAFNDSKTKIRASQGHSVNIDLGYEEQTPLDILYHGTPTASLDSIWKSGLKKMKRHHVHLSSDVETAQIVGGRRGKHVVLKVDSKKMYEDGHKFYISDNGVWLTDHIPPAYLSFWTHGE